LGDEGARKTSRRKFIGTAAGAVVLAGAAAAGVGYYLGQQGPTPPGPVTTITVPGPERITTESVTTAAPPPSPGPVSSVVWPFRPDIAKENVEIYQKQYNDVVNLSVIGGNYPATLETMFISGAPLDHCYAAMEQASKWYAAKWIKDMEDHPLIADIKRDMYPSHIPYYEAPDGKMMGLPYYVSSMGVIATNEKLLEKAGFADTKTKSGEYPSTYDELYAQCETIRSKGITDTPWLPRVEGTFVGSYPFIAEAADRGDPLFDKEYNAVFDTNSPIKDTFKAWKDLSDKGLFPKWTFTASENDVILAFASGKYAYGSEQMYDLKLLNDPAQSQIAGFVSVVPVKKQPWGFFTQSINVMTNRTRTSEKQRHVDDYLAFFSHKDKNGELLTAKKWVISSALYSSYRDVLSDPEVKASLAGWVYRDTDLKEFDAILSAAPFPALFKCPWGSEWLDNLATTLPDVLDGKVSIDGEIDSLRKYADDLKRRYTG
jgi:multiple sugar transport system substrate-binding protein